MLCAVKPNIDVTSLMDDIQDAARLDAFIADYAEMKPILSSFVSTSPKTILEKRDAVNLSLKAMKKSGSVFRPYWQSTLPLWVFFDNFIKLLEIKKINVLFCEKHGFGLLLDEQEHEPCCRKVVSVSQIDCNGGRVSKQFFDAMGFFTPINTPEWAQSQEVALYGS